MIVKRFWKRYFCDGTLMVKVWGVGTEPQVGVQRRLEFYVYGLRGNFAAGFNRLSINQADK
jgi:hypothetical protein